MKQPISSQGMLWAGFILLCLVLILLWPRFVGSSSPEGSPDFPHASMTIERADGKKIPFDIEVAKTPEQEAYGLMFRRSLAQGAGMLFLWPDDQIVRMWMKNTFIPLDMLYVSHDGTIVKIIRHAEPFDLTPLSSDQPVRAVVEINGGEAGRLGLAPGDKILYPGFTSKSEP